MELNQTNSEELNVDHVVSEEQSTSNSNDDFKKILISVVIFFRRSKLILKKYLWLFLTIFIIGLGSTIYLILNKEVEYQARLLFILQEENRTNSPSDLADPLSNYLLTRATSQSINLDKVKEIVFSQKLMSNLLFNKCIINGSDNYLINHILSIYYNSDQSFFKSYRGLNGLNRNQYRVFANVSNILINSMDISETKAGGYVLKIILKNEELTKVTCELLYQNLNNFYIDKTTEKAQANYVFLRNRLDSVRNMLYSSEYQVANFEDRARNLLLNTARVPQIRQQRNTEFYQSLYGNLIVTFENSKVALNNITPIFQLLQRPYYPLDEITPSSKIILLITMLVTSLVMVFILFGLYFKIYIWPQYKDYFKVEKELI